MASQSNPPTAAHQHSSGGDGGVLSISATIVGSDQMQIFARRKANQAVFNNNASTGAGTTLGVLMAMG